MAANLDERLLTEALIELKGCFPGFQWESELWVRHGHRRSPYRVLVLFGLSPRTQDAQLVEMCRAFFERFPSPEALGAAEACLSTTAKNIVRKGQLPFIENLARFLGERGAIPDDADALVQVNGVGDKVAECVLAYGWGHDALPVDGNVIRIVARICGIPAAGKLQDAKVLREQLKWAYRKASANLAAARIAMIDVHEILRLHAQTCCGKTPECNRCPVTGCRSRREPRTDEGIVVDPRAWDDWRELIIDPQDGRELLSQGAMDNQNQTAGEK